MARGRPKSEASIYKHPLYKSWRGHLHRGLEGFDGVEGFRRYARVATSLGWRPGRGCRVTVSKDGKCIEISSHPERFPEYRVWMNMWNESFDLTDRGIPTPVSPIWTTFFDFQDWVRLVKGVVIDATNYKSIRVRRLVASCGFEPSNCFLASY